MQLHHQAVLHAHARHFHQHVPGERVRVVRTRFARERALEQRVDVLA